MFVHNLACIKSLIIVLKAKHTHDFHLKTDQYLFWSSTYKYYKKEQQQQQKNEDIIILKTPSAWIWMMVRPDILAFSPA